MITSFKTLFTVSVSHAYYAETCNDLEFLLSADSREILRGAKVIWRMNNGVLYFLYETDAAGAPRESLSGETIRLRLRLLNPYFTNFTDLNMRPKRVLHYRNGTEAEKLDEAKEVFMTGDLVPHSVESKVRPLTVVLRDRSGSVLAEEAVTEEGLAELRFSLSGYPPGLYTVEEGSTGGGTITEYYRDAEMLKAGALGIAEITIADTFYNYPQEAPLRLSFPFKAREELLEYYVVAKNYSEEELDQLKVEDRTPGNGGNGESRTFDRRPSEEMTPGYKTLGGSDAVVALFRSKSLIPRRETGSRKIQLLRNGEPLIKSLPLPAADKAEGKIVIHISK